MSDATLTEEPLDAETALPAADDALETAEQDGPSCDKCGFPTDAAACLRCGWYPSLGIHVDVDESFETFSTASEATAPADDDEPDELIADTTPEWRKHLEVWSGMIPAWGWLLIVTTVGLVALGIAIRVTTATNPTVQTYCGVGGLIGGVLVALVAHLIAFLICSFDDADFGLLDPVIKPFKIWKVIVAELPTRLTLTNSVNIGLTTALTAALIIGGIPYERLLDWGFKARAKQTFVNLIAEEAGKNRGDSRDLEGAITEFASEAGDMDADAKPPEELPRKPLDCLIVGYQAGKEGGVGVLYLAADAQGKLKYVGTIRPELAPGELRELADEFAEHPSSRPLVQTPETASWLAPRFMCRVTYTEWERDKRPKNLRWEEMLDEVRLPW